MRDFALLGVVFLTLAACGVAYHSSGIVFNHTGSMPSRRPVACPTVYWSSPAPPMPW
jgi:hypothetical protein